MYGGYKGINICTDALYHMSLGNFKLKHQWDTTDYNNGNNSKHWQHQMLSRVVTIETLTAVAENIKWHNDFGR